MSGFRMFQGNGAFQYGSTADFSNLSTVDAPQHTLLIFETMPQNAEYWTEPDEIPFNPANPLAGLTLAPDFFLAATADKEIKEINPSVAPQTFAAFATWDGHEILSDAQYANLYVNWDAADNATISTQKLQAIYQALMSFENTYDAFPPGHAEVPASWIDPTTGMPYLSWRVYLLPFLGYTDLFNQFHLNEPWNSPNNIGLLGDMPQEFRSRGLSPGTTLSAFKLIVGPDAYNVTIARVRQWPASLRPHRRISTTISVVELTPDQAVPWTQWSDDPIFRGESTVRLRDDPLGRAADLDVGRKRSHHQPKRHGRQSGDLRDLQSGGSVQHGYRGQRLHRLGAGRHDGQSCQ